jgi:hypothetical protein
VYLESGGRLTSPGPRVALVRRSQGYLHSRFVRSRIYRHAHLGDRDPNSFGSGEAFAEPLGDRGGVSLQQSHRAISKGFGRDADDLSVVGRLLELVGSREGTPWELDVRVEDELLRERPFGFADAHLALESKAANPEGVARY